MDCLKKESVYRERTPVGIIFAFIEKRFDLVIYNSIHMNDSRLVLK